MSNHQQTIAIIKSLTGQANVLTIPRVFVDFMGSLDGGLFLSQLLYWSDRNPRKDGWFYKTYGEWQSEICLSEYEVKKQVKKLVERGLLETKVKKANGNPTVHYHLKVAEFSDSFLEFLQKRIPTKSGNEPLETAVSITETTTKPTNIDDDSKGGGHPPTLSPSAASPSALEIYKSVTKIKKADKIPEAVTDWLAEQEQYMAVELHPEALRQAIKDADKEGQVFNVEVLDTGFLDNIPTVTNAHFTQHGKNGKFTIASIDLSNGEHLEFAAAPEWVRTTATKMVKEHLQNKAAQQGQEEE